MLSQSAIRSVWAPACRGPFTTVRLHGAGKVQVRPAIYVAVLSLNSCLRQWNYVTRYADTGAYVCRATTGKSTRSTHAYGIALDINWQSNPYGRYLRTNMPRAMVNAICGIRTNNGKQVWNWGGFWRGNKDAMHFEIVCSPRDIATGINPRTVPGGTYVPPAAKPTPAKPKPKPVPPKPKVKMIYLMQAHGQNEVYITDLVTKTHVLNKTSLGGHQIMLKQRGLPTNIIRVDAAYLNTIPTNYSQAEKLTYAQAIVNNVKKALGK